MELFHFLSKILGESTIKFDSQPSDQDFNIFLNVLDHTSRSDHFQLQTDKHGLSITGQGRTDVLYGVYEFLRMQGWRWFSPEPEGEVTPAPRKTLNLPQKTKEYAQH